MVVAIRADGGTGPAHRNADARGRAPGSSTSAKPDGWSASPRYASIGPTPSPSTRTAKSMAGPTICRSSPFLDATKTARTQLGLGRCRSHSQAPGGTLQCPNIPPSYGCRLRPRVPCVAQQLQQASATGLAGPPSSNPLDAQGLAANRLQTKRARRDVKRRDEAGQIRRESPGRRHKST